MNEERGAMYLERIKYKFGWLIKDRKTQQVAYHGEIDLVSSTINPQHAILWYNENKEHFRVCDYSCYGEVWKMELPMRTQEALTGKSIKITDMFIDVIADLASDRVLKEKNFGFWKEFLKKYDLYEESVPEPMQSKQYFVLKKEHKEFKEIKVINPLTQLEEVIEISEIQRLKELVAKKEFLDGLIKHRGLTIKGKTIEQPYENLLLLSQNTTAFGHYTTALRHQLFKDTRYYRKIKPGETLQPRQWRIKLLEGWITAIIAPRRGGKSYYATCRIIEEFTKDKQTTDKPVRVIFIGINKKKNRTVINYILAMSKEFVTKGYFDRNASDQIMYYKEKGVTRDKDKVLGSIEFIGARDEDAGVGDSADLIIIDECERIQKSVREDIFPIITNEGAKCILISTLNKRSEKTWFYNVIIKGEKEELKRGLIHMSAEDIIENNWRDFVQPHIDSGLPFEERIQEIDIEGLRKKMMMERMRVGIRFTGEDIDYWTEMERDIARDALKDNPDVYYPERWGIFPEDIKTYNYESAIKPAINFSGKQYKYVVVSYDPAESRDKAAIVYLGRDENEKKVEIIKCVKLPNNYTFHGPYIKKCLKEAEGYVAPQGLRTADKCVFFTYDYNGVGHGLEPYLIEVGIRIDLKIRFESGGSVNKKGNLHSVSKNYIVSITQNIFEHGSILINEECTELTSEMENYQGVTNEKTGQTRYRAGTGSDDFVSSMMMGIYFILDYMGEKSKISKTTYEQMQDESSGSGTVSDEQRNKLYIAELRKGRTVEEITDEANRQLGLARTLLRKKDLLSKFGY